MQSIPQYGMQLAFPNAEGNFATDHMALRVSGAQLVLRRSTFVAKQIEISVAVK